MNPRIVLSPDQRADPAMGVTVQSMVDATVAGVLFTCNPVSGDPSMIAINASWGLGVAVVGGEVTPDDYLVSKVTGEVVREQVGTKAFEYVQDPSGTGTARLDVPVERRSVSCLEPSAIAELVDVARAIERHFGSPQDVEWAVESDCRVLLLQSRPETVWSRKPRTPAATLGGNYLTSMVNTLVAPLHAKPRADGEH